MSNRDVGVYASTPGYKNSVLLKGERLVDVSDGGRMVTGDGVTPGGVPHVTRYPTAPITPIANGWPRLRAAANRRFFDTVGNHLIPTAGDGGPNNGIPTPALGLPSMWQMACYHASMYEQYLVAPSPTLLNRIAGQWAYMKAKFSAQQLGTAAALGSLYNTQDDASWYVTYLRQVHEVTGDATALGYLVEQLAVIQNLFLSPDPGAATKDYGVATPGGVEVKWTTTGLTYDRNIAQGYFNSTYELPMGIVAIYVSQQPSVAAPLRAAYLQYAQDLFDLTFAMLRTPDPATDPINPATAPAQGIYYASANLDPNCHTYDARQTYHQGYWFAGNNRAPVRNMTSYFDGGTQMMGVLSAYLYKATGAAKYLAEAQSIANVYDLPTAFGRTFNGKPIIGNIRDPWANHFYLGEFVRHVLLDGAIAADPDNSLRIAIYNAAQAALAVSQNGCVTPDFAGPEYSTVTGTSFWVEDNLNDYGGYYRGGQGREEQIMCTGLGLVVVLAGLQIEAAYPNIGSGDPRAVSIEMIEARLAAIEAALVHKVGHQETIFNGPIRREKDTYLDFNTNGYLNLGKGAYVQYDRSSGYWGIYKDGDRKFYIGSATGAADAMFFNTRLAANFYAAYGNGPFINFDSNSYLGLNATAVRYELTLGSKLLWYADGNGSFNFLGDLVPRTDNSHSAGTAANRLSQIYAGSATINTSDVEEKVIRGALSEVELAVAKEIAATVVVYQFKDSVAEKGSDKARLHVGYGAQTVFDIFTRHGLDPHAYGICCWDQWDADPGRPEVAAVEAEPEELDADGRVVKPAVPAMPLIPAIPARAAGSRYGLRYDELNAFVAAAQEQRAAAQEQRLAALEAKAA